MTSQRCSIVLLLLALCPLTQAQGVFDDSINLLANRLVEDQIRTAFLEIYGSWPDEEWATGSITIGMTYAFERSGVEAYRTTMNRAGSHIVMNISSHNNTFYGDSAYALIKIQEANPSHTWLNPLQEYYDLVDSMGIDNYLQEYDAIDPSMAAYYLAHHVLAVYSLDRPDKSIWRDKLISTLSKVDDEAHFPVMALALSVWTLAETGSLDETLVDANALDTSYWYQKSLKDLPSLLMSHKVPMGQADEGSYFWKFNHLGGPEDAIVPSGYTEDVVYGSLAFLSLYNQAQDANEANSNDDPSDDVVLEGTWMEQMDPNLAEIDHTLVQAETILVNAIQEDGSVCAHVSLGGDIYYTFAGEVLHALCLLDQYEENWLGIAAESEVQVLSK